MSKQFVPRVKPGDPFSARVINQIAEAAERAGTIHPDDGETVTNVLGTFRAGDDPTVSKFYRVKITDETVNTTVTPNVRYWEGVAQRKNSDWGVVNGAAYWEDTTTTLTPIVPWDDATTLEVDEVVLVTKVKNSPDWQALGNVC